MVQYGGSERHVMVRIDDVAMIVSARHAAHHHDPGQQNQMPDKGRIHDRNRYQTQRKSLPSGKAPYMKRGEAYDHDPLGEWRPS